jgi:hypothetical protein
VTCTTFADSLCRVEEFSEEVGDHKDKLLNEIAVALAGTGVSAA